MNAIWDAIALGRRGPCWARWAACLVAVGLLVGLAARPPGVAAQEPGQGAEEEEAPVEAVVSRVVEEGFIQVIGEMQPYQTLEMTLLRPRDGVERVVVHNSLAQGGAVGELEVGDRVWLQPTMDLEGQPGYLIACRSRAGALAWAAVILVAAVVLVGQWHGVRALLGLGLSFLIVFVYIIPRIAAGGSPVGVSLLGLGATMPVAYYLAHGLNRKTTVALAGSLVALLFTGLLAEWVAGATHLSGLGSEEAAFLLGVYRGQVDVRALLLAGMLISILGVLDDITVAQAAVVEQLAAANPSWPREQLAWRAMLVGRDHIASMVNTLVLVYAGAGLPLLLLLTNRRLPLGYTLSFELVTEEVVRILVSSIGLVAAVPLTTLLAAHVMGARGGRAPAEREPLPYD